MGCHEGLPGPAKTEKAHPTVEDFIGISVFWIEGKFFMFTISSFYSLLF